MSDSLVTSSGIPEDFDALCEEVRRRTRRAERGRPPTEAGWGAAQPELDAVLSTTPGSVAEVADLLGRVQRVLDTLPPGPSLNRVARFNDLYHIITRDILAYLGAGRFVDPLFLETLDVEFAKLYLDAVRRWGDPALATPQVWSALFRRGEDLGTTPLAAAVAGVNAHINFDLAFALVSTWERLGVTDVDDKPHPDYLLINEIFFAAIPGLRWRNEVRWQRIIDRLDGSIDDWSQSMLVEFTRELAWGHAKRIWPLRGDPDAFDRARGALDHGAALVGLTMLTADRWCAWMADRMSLSVSRLLDALRS